MTLPRPGRRLACSKDRRTAGIALPFTLLALLLVSFSLVAVMALALMEEAGSAAHLRILRAEGEAERNAVRAIDAWPPADLAVVPVGSTRTASAGRRRVRRLRPDLFLFSGQGVGAGGVFRTRSWLVEMRPPPVGLQTAVSSPGAVRVSAGAAVLGPPGAAGCDVSDSTASGWLPQATFLYPREDPLPWLARAEVRIAGGTIVQPGPRASSGACVLTDPSNWGDPGSAGVCALHRPVVHVTGDLTVTGGVGQGILVVDGDLVVRGGFHFEGLVLVGGGLTIAGAGATMRGAVQAVDVHGTGSDIGPGGRITYSTCVVQSVTRRFGSLATLSGGGWLGGY